MHTRPDDDAWMLRALALARRGAGLTRPNPPVGAVIVRGGRVLGEGWHRRAGGPHAEAEALAAAGARARGATLYVTLEPCCTRGRTPPCTAAILRAGIRRVVVAMRDPNPRHNGRGLRLLRRAGIEVVEGVGAGAAAAVLAPFACWIATGRPRVALKLAMSLDGKIADRRGRARWISGEPARRLVHEWRRAADAILVGAGTALADNPSLLPRPARGRRPFRIVVDARGRLPAAARIFTDGRADRTIVATTRRCPAPRRAAWQAAGARVWVLPPGGGGVSLSALLARLGRLGLLEVLCEGGAELGAALIRGRWADELRLFLAPLLIGGRTAPGAVGGPGWPLERAPRLAVVEWRRVGCDLLVRAVPAPCAARGRAVRAGPFSGCVARLPPS